MFALIDSNNFFVSCERLFRPDLEGRPVVVLSSNDGCAVSRSNEAKALGIPMGAPVFKYRELFEKESVVSFSANFELYGDISERISATLMSITPRIELYSVDESFLDLSALDIADYDAWGRAVRATILQSIGIPVSIGIAPSKTLCKLAGDRAKKQPELAGALYLDPQERPHITQEARIRTLVQDIWGVGWRLGPRLRAESVMTAEDLAHMRPRRAQQLMGIHGRHMVYELNGTSCLPLQQRTKPQQFISRGRQFGADTNHFETIEAAVATLTARAAGELRRERQRCGRAAVILRTNRFKPGYAHLYREIVFAAPTADTGLIAAKLTRALEDDYNAQLQYHRAEVFLFELTPAETLQLDVFGTINHHNVAREQRRTDAIDAINAKLGYTRLRYAAEKLSDTWRPRSKLLSPRYTSDWSELPEAWVR